MQQGFFSLQTSCLIIAQNERPKQTRRLGTTGCAAVLRVWEIDVLTVKIQHGSGMRRVNANLMIAAGKLCKCEVTVFLQNVKTGVRPLSRPNTSLRPMETNQLHGKKNIEHTPEN